VSPTGAPSRLIPPQTRSGSPRPWVRWTCNNANVDLVNLGNSWVASGGNVFHSTSRCSNSLTAEGRIGEVIPLVAAESSCDLIALGWSQELSANRAPIVAETLARSNIPVLLVPVQLPAEFEGVLAASSKGDGDAIHD
jgi:hypothetical protein